MRGVNKLERRRDVSGTGIGTAEPDAERLALPLRSVKEAALDWLTRDRRVGERLLKKLLVTRKKEMASDHKIANAKFIRGSRPLYRILEACTIGKRAWEYCPSIIVGCEKGARVVDYGGAYGVSGYSTITKYNIEYYYLHDGKLSVGAISCDESDFRIGDEGVVVADKNNPIRHLIKKYVREDA